MLFFLHSFVNLFAGGRSDSKTILFPLYVLVLVLLIKFGKNIFTKLSIWWGIISIIALYLYGLVSHIILFRYYKLPLTSFAITGNNGELSSTTLSHIHEAKGIIGFILSKFGVLQLQNIDAGGAYVHLLPSWWFVAGAVFLVSSILFVTFYIRGLSSYYSTDNKWKNIFFVLWYATLSFSLVKTAIDGGILTPSLLSLVASIFLFKYMEKQKDARIPLLTIFISAIVGLVLVLIFPDWVGGIAIMQLFGTLLLLTTLSLGIFTAPKKTYVVISVLLLLVSWWMASVRDQEVFRYGQVLIEKGDKYFSYNMKSHSLDKKISDRDSTISNFVKAQGRNLSYGPISVAGKTCSEGGLAQVADVVIQTKKPIQTINTPYLSIAVTEQSFHDPWWVNRATIVMQPCLPEVLTVIDDTLKEHRFDFYVMVNPLFHDEPIAH